MTAKFVAALFLLSCHAAVADQTVNTSHYEIAKLEGGTWIVVGQFEHVRTDRRVAMRDSRNGYWDIWQRGDGGRVGLERVVPSLEAFVEIDSGELSARNLTFDWDALSEPFPPSIMQACRSGSSTTETECEIDAAGRVTRLRFRVGGSYEEWRMLNIPGTDEPKTEAILSAPKSFHRWDAADFGDQENLPALRDFQKAARLESLFGTHSDHAH